MTQVLGRSIFAALALVLSFGAYAADKKADTGKVSKGDRSFIMDAANDSLAEIELGKVAQQNAASDDVKKFGQRMVDDHSKANQELMPIAQKLGVELPTAPQGKHARMVKDLSKKNGAKFDKDYVNDMVNDHKKAVKLFETKSKKADNEELRQFAAKTLPTLQEHLKMAQDMQASMKKTKASK
jgi:putative membrane protein